MTFGSGSSGPGCTTCMSNSWSGSTASLQACRSRVAHSAGSWKRKNWPWSKTLRPADMIDIPYYYRGSKFRIGRNRTGMYGPTWLQLLDKLRPWSLSAQIRVEPGWVVHWLHLHMLGAWTWHYCQMTVQLWKQGCWWMSGSSERTIGSVQGNQQHQTPRIHRRWRQQLQIRIHYGLGRSYLGQVQCGRGWRGNGPAAEPGDRTRPQGRLWWFPHRT